MVTLAGKSGLTGSAAEVDVGNVYSTAGEQRDRRLDVQTRDRLAALWRGGSAVPRNVLLDTFEDTCHICASPSVALWRSRSRTPIGQRATRSSVVHVSYVHCTSGLSEPRTAACMHAGTLSVPTDYPPSQAMDRVGAQVASLSAAPGAI